MKAGNYFLCFIDKTFKRFQLYCQRGYLLVGHICGHLQWKSREVKPWHSYCGDPDRILMETIILLFLFSFNYYSLFYHRTQECASDPNFIWKTTQSRNICQGYLSVF